MVFLAQRLVFPPAYVHAGGKNELDQIIVFLFSGKYDRGRGGDDSKRALISLDHMMPNLST